MIDQVVVFLKDQLNDYLSSDAVLGSPENIDDWVMLLNGEKVDPIGFRPGAVTTLLINLEEEKVLRPADRYRRTRADGTTLSVQPEIRLQLFVLFVAQFSHYEEGLKVLSWIIRYFQNHRVLEASGSQGFPAGLEKLMVEMVTLPFSEQNEVWNALRTTYHPSVLFKVTMTAFQDEAGIAAPTVTAAQVNLGAKP